MVWVGIPNTNIGFELQLPDPVELANKLWNDVASLVSGAFSHITNVLNDVAKNIGSFFKNVMLAIPTWVWNRIKDLWSAFMSVWRK